MSSLPLHLMRHDVDVAFVRLPAGEEPTFDWRTGPLASVTYTESETSVVCAFDSVPEGVRAQGPLTAFEIAGWAWPCTIEPNPLWKSSMTEPSTSHTRGPLPFAR